MPKITKTESPAKDYFQRGQFGDTLEDEINYWPESRYQTMFGRVFDCSGSLEESFTELHRVKDRLLEYLDYWIGDHGAIVGELDQACVFLQMANGALMATLGELEKSIERCRTLTATAAIVASPTLAKAARKE